MRLGYLNGEEVNNFCCKKVKTFIPGAKAEFDTEIENPWTDPKTDPLRNTAKKEHPSPQSTGTENLELCDLVLLLNDS